MAKKFNFILSPFKKLKDKLRPARLSPADVELIKNSRLFNNIDKTRFDKMIRSARLTRHKAGKLILKEGARGDELYIISEGAVLIFTYDMNGIKIPLNELRQGEYFGEQAPIGKIIKMRNASVEAITDVVLICIEGKYIQEQIQVDNLLKAKLEEIRYNEAVNVVTSSTGLYNEVEWIFHEIEEPNVIEFRNNEYIFKAGDVADNAYIILQGKVKLLIPDKITGTFSRVMLSRGHLFGELGVIRNAPRAATAIAHSNLRLLAIDRDVFKKQVEKSQQLQQILSALQEIYKIPMKDTVEQYVGNGEDGSAITNVYKLSDGRLIMSSKTLKDNIFTMATVNQPGIECYQYKKGSNSIELEIANSRIVGIKADGIFDVLPDLCRLLLDNKMVQENALENFELTGKL